MTYDEARQIEAEEHAAYSSALLERALAYAAQKRADDYERATGVKLSERDKFGKGGFIRLPMYTLDGRQKTLVEWCRSYRQEVHLVQKRLGYGWGLKDALTVPPHGKRKFAPGVRAPKRVPKGPQRGGVRAPLHLFEGESLTLRQWSERTGIKLNTIQKRMCNGASIEEALTTPVGRRANHTAHGTTPG